MDTVGAWLVHKLERDRGATIVGANPRAAAADRPCHRRRPAGEGEARLCAAASSAWSARSAPGPRPSCGTLLGLLGFFGAMLISFGNIIRHPRRFRFNAVVTQFEVVGVHALCIIGLMSFLVGIVIAQQGAVQLRQFGAEVFTINLIGRSAVKELGVLMTAIMVAGRSGSAFAAQIRLDEAERGNRRDAHDRRLADGGAGHPARARDGADDAAARLLSRR